MRRSSRGPFRPRPSSTCTASRRARWRWRPSGPAAPAWPASRSARWPSSTSPSSCRCAASWSRTAPWTRCSPRRCRPSTRPATPSANRSASAARGPRRCPSRSRTRARSRSTCSGSSATTPRSIRAIRRVTQTFASPAARGGRGFRHSLRRRIERRQRRAPRRRGGALRGAGRVQHRRARGRDLQVHRHHRSALLQYDPQRVSRLRREIRDPALHQLPQRAVRGRQARSDAAAEAARRPSTTRAISAASTRATRRRAIC